MLNPKAVHVIEALIDLGMDLRHGVFGSLTYYTSENWVIFIQQGQISVLRLLGGQWARAGLYELTRETEEPEKDQERHPGGRKCENFFCFAL